MPCEMHHPNAHSTNPLTNCTGMIHDLLLPMRLLYSESTIGDHMIFKEYGYVAIEKIPSDVNEVSFAKDFSRNGTVPKANPTGMP